MVKRHFLLFENVELCTCGEVLSVLRALGGEAHVAGTHGLIEDHALERAIVGKGSGGYGLSPCLSVHADLHLIILYVAVVAVLAWQVAEAL